MSSRKPVVVYAASGYTGRLVCRALTRLRVPFVAAGRSQARLEEVVKEMRAGGADCEARAAEHSPPALRDVFRGAEVVINISGPFSRLGHAVVDAALVEGCHYLDSTGEQDFMLDVRRQYGDRFQRAKRLLSPSAAFLWAPGTAATELCLETYPELDSFDVVYAPPSLQTVASLQSMIRTARRPGYSILDQQLQLVPSARMRQKLPIPGQKVRRALRIGAGEATALLGDARVRRCETWFASDDLARFAPLLAAWSDLSKVVAGDALDRWSDALILGLKKDPPAEEPETGRFTIAVTGSGGGRTVRATLGGTSPYLVTGFLCAMAAQSLLEGKAQRFGYRSLGQAFGARIVLQRLEEVGTCTTIEAEGPRQPSPTGTPRRTRDAAGAHHVHR
jgi:short subunit dehydrogenase-like uncharacterized protein